MLQRLFDFVFGCSHKRCTFPITVRTKGLRGEPYVVCLDCGREFPYDWNRMEVVTR